MSATERESFRQPAVHELAVAVAAPTAVLSAPGGDVGVGGSGRSAEGVFHADTRVLSRLTVTLDSSAAEELAGVTAGPGRHHFVIAVRHVGGGGTDAMLRLDRHRTVTPGRVEERLVVISAADEPIDTTVVVHLRADLLPIEAVKAGRHGTPRRGAADGVDGVTWSTSRVAVHVRGIGADSSEATGGRDAEPPGWAFTWRLRLEPAGQARLAVQIDVHDSDSAVTAPSTSATWARPEVVDDDRRLARLIDQSLDDLHGLRMTDSHSPGHVFLAAGAPWFFTLFGRDSVWAARMLLPLGTDLAGDTLRVLARRQGTRDDPRSEEEPGKILHELRRDVFDDGAGLVIPPVYFGSVDATPLWVCLLHDAWRWGLATAEVEALLPALEAALDWVAAAAEAGGGFLRYLARRGSGLANQGWKDSGDAVRFADGSHAGPPVALAEVQGYAYEAALDGAVLLDAFGRPGADRWRAFAAKLRRDVRTAYWVEDTCGRYPAMALDGDNRPVDAVASNMGHLLLSGLLDDDETDAVAQRLSSSSMSSGYGLRTMADTAAGFGSLRYHCGTVWPHDTIIAVDGLIRTGHPEHAAVLVDGLLAAATAFHNQLPELWSGDARSDISEPVRYPAACRPQAWAAASSIALLSALLGLDPDAPRGTIAIRPAVPSPVGAISARGLIAAGARLDVAVTATGEVTRFESAANLTRST